MIPQNFIRHKVRPDDTLTSLAQRINISENDLKEFHNQNCGKMNKLWVTNLKGIEFVMIPTHFITEEEQENQNRKMLPSENYFQNFHANRYSVEENFEHPGKQESKFNYIVNLNIQQKQRNFVADVELKNYTKNGSVPDDKISSLSLECMKSIYPISFEISEKDYNFDIVNNPNILLKHKESVISSMAFWYWKDLQLKSGGKEIVDSITKIVNEATSTYELRKSNFDKTYSAFQVDKCDRIKNEESESNGEWRMPIDNPMLCMYSQGGGHKPWHGSFGKDIRDGSTDHTGNDLLAVPGTKVYACVKSIVHKIYTSTSMAGNVVVLKVLDVEVFKSLRNNNYIPKYKSKGEILQKGFDENKTIYLTFWHLSKTIILKKVKK
jgi:murein DD-endopeptidase MepM/ murein hydrolase activator NlpD